jgi:hypothetical protein
MASGAENAKKSFAFSSPVAIHDMFFVTFELLCYLLLYLSTSAVHTGYLFLEEWVMSAEFFCRGKRFHWGWDLHVAVSDKKGNTNHSFKVTNLRLTAAREQGYLATIREAHLFPTYVHAVCVKA